MKIRLTIRATISFFTSNQKVSRKMESLFVSIVLTSSVKFAPMPLSSLITNVNLLFLKFRDFLLVPRV